MKTPLRLVAVAFALGLALAFMTACDWEGDTFRMHLRNDTEEILEIGLCGNDCDKTAFSEQVEPGDSYPSSNTVGILSWYRVQNEEGTVLGCIRIYEPDERPEINELYISTILASCP